MRIVITGGTGMIGRHIVAALVERGDEVVVLSHDPAAKADRVQPGARVVAWDPHDLSADWVKALDGAAGVVNLAGANIGDWPWTAARKRLLVDSRVTATTAIVGAMAMVPAERRPRVLVSVSGTDRYDGRDAVPATEETEPATTFLANLCVAWEDAAVKAEALDVRVVRPRFSVVLSREAKSLRSFALPFRLFVGGPIAGGRQWVSWVHIDDVVAIVLWALDDDAIDGPINVAAPDPRQQADFARALGRVLHRPSFLPTPGWPFRLAFPRGQSTLVLGSRRVWPARALAAGYRFRYPQLEDALEQELG